MYIYGAKAFVVVRVYQFYVALVVINCDLGAFLLLLVLLLLLILVLLSFFSPTSCLNLDTCHYFQGTLTAIRDWFRDYKIPDGKPANKFGLGNKAADKVNFHNF